MVSIMWRAISVASGPVPTIRCAFDLFSIRSDGNFRKDAGTRSSSQIINCVDQQVCVESVGQTLWWIPWLPVLGSLIVAVAAVIGVMVSNKTNIKAIDAADMRAQNAREESQRRDSQARLRDAEREFRIWRRNTIMRIAGDISGAALSAVDAFQDIATHETSRADDPGTLAPFEEAVRSIHALASSLLFIGERDLAEMAKEFSYDLRDKTLKRRIVNLNIAFRRMREPDPPPELCAYRDSEREALLEELGAVRAKVENFAEATRTVLSSNV